MLKLKLVQILFLKREIYRNGKLSPGTHTESQNTLSNMQSKLIREKPKALIITQQNSLQWDASEDKVYFKRNWSYTASVSLHKDVPLTAIYPIIIFLALMSKTLMFPYNDCEVV